MPAEREITYHPTVLSPTNKPVGSQNTSKKSKSKNRKNKGRGQKASNARSSRGARGSGGGPQRPNPPPRYSASQTLTFGSYSGIPWNEEALNAPGIKKIHFSPSFEIQNAHLDAIRSRPALAASLQSLSLGDSDTGNGFYLSDQAVINFANACTNLVICQLDATTKLTDAALIAICQSCTSLETLQITGNDKSRGSLRGEGFTFLAENPTIAPNLKQLVLLDQNTDEKKCKQALKQLSVKRESLAIHTGETLGDGMADQMIAAMSGGAGSEVMMGGKFVSYDVDMGIFGEGGYGSCFRLLYCLVR